MAAFGVGFVLSLTTVVFCAIATFGNSHRFSPSDENLLQILFINAFLIIILAAVVGVRLTRRIRGRRFGEPAPRLHLRFVGLFSLAAATPALLSAVFLGAVLNRGVDYWFGERVNTLMEGAASLAAEVVERESLAFVSAARPIYGDLSAPQALRELATSRIAYTQRLQNLGRLYGMDGVWVIDGAGTILARAEVTQAGRFFIPDLLQEEGRVVDEVPPLVPYQLPTQTMWEEARQGLFKVEVLPVRDDGRVVVWGFQALNPQADIFLYSARIIDDGFLQRSEQALTDYRSLSSDQSEIRVTFLMVYAELAALILIGAIWLGLSAATRVVTPISRLVAAAERVRRGDLDARVQLGREGDEVTALGRAFNRMTRQLRSQRRELVESHAESEQRRAFTEAVLAGVSAGVVGLDHEDRITLINRSAVSLLEPRTEDLVGATIHDVTPELCSIVDEARRRPGLVADAQIDLVGRDDQSRYLNARAALDEEAGLIITFDDVTRLVTAQRNAAWRDVARRIAHEIKNPLTPIQLSAERLQRKYRKYIEVDGETFDRCTDTIVRQVSDIGRMVDEFSSFARMPTPQVEPTEMLDVSQAAVFAQRVATPQIELTHQRPDDPVWALCDARLARQALTNILKNASESVLARVDRDGGEGPPGRLEVETRSEDGFAIIEVVDNGLGWPTADRERLTEPYMTTREKGTGLGLAIVKRVMEDHKGRLELGVPDDHPGAVVRLVFPLADHEDIPTEETRKEA